VRDKKIVLLDYYGTLVELDSPFKKIDSWVKEYLAANHRHVDTARFGSRYTKNRAVMTAGQPFSLGIDLLTNCLSKTCSDFGIKDFKEEFSGFIFELFTSPKPFPDAHSVISRLRENYKVGLLTNADNCLLYKSIDNCRFAFDFVISSEDAAANKPDIEIFRYALNKLGVLSDQSVLIGDSQVDDVYGAAKAGMDAIWINRRNETLRDEIKPPIHEVACLNDLLKIFSL